MICPWSQLRQRADDLWTTEDPVHMTGIGYDLVANMILEAAAGASDDIKKKRPLTKPEASNSKRSHPWASARVM